VNYVIFGDPPGGHFGARQPFWQHSANFHLRPSRLALSFGLRSAEKPSFENSIVSGFLGGRHVCFGHSFNLVAGYVCILLAALADIHLGECCHVQSAGNQLSLGGYLAA